MRTTQTITISLPPAMAIQIEQVRKLESRTCSELIREALRTYFESRYPAVEPTAAELAGLPQKDFKKLPAKEQGRVRKALLAMQQDPFSGGCPTPKGPAQRVATAG